MQYNIQILMVNILYEYEEKKKKESRDLNSDESELRPRLTHIRLQTVYDGRPATSRAP